MRNDSKKIQECLNKGIRLIPIAKMDREQIWEAIVDMPVGDFLMASDHNMSIKEICYDFAYEQLNACQIFPIEFTKGEMEYIYEKMIEYILISDIESFVKELIPVVKLHRKGRT